MTHTRGATPFPVSPAVPVPAILCLIAATFLNSTTDAMAKTLVLAGASVPFILWARYTVQLVTVTVIFRAWRNPSCYRTRRWGLHVVRSAMILTAGVFAYLALMHLQLFEFVSIVFTIPIFTMVIGRLALAETVEPRRWFAVALGMLGVLIITRPGTQQINPGHFYALGATLSYCVFTILTRVLTRTERTDTLMFIPAVLLTVVLTPFAPELLRVEGGFWTWFNLGSVGMLGAIAHILTVHAYRQGTASGLAPYFYTQILWVLLYGFVLFGDLPDLWMIVGSGCIVASGIYLAHRDRMAAMPETSVTGG